MHCSQSEVVSMDVSFYMRMFFVRLVSHERRPDRIHVGRDGPKRIQAP